MGIWWEVYEKFEKELNDFDEDSELDNDDEEAEFEADEENSSDGDA